jgi:hypothetical protein
LNETALLWFERLYSRLRIPFFVGAVFVSLLVLGILALCYLLGGVWGDFLLLYAYFASVRTGVVLLCQVVSRYASKQVEGLVEYSKSMTEDNKSISTEALYSLKGILLMWGLFLLIVQPLYYFSAPKSYTPYQSFLTWYAPFIYFDFFIATLIWVMVYSMVSIYRMGKLQIRLTHFAKDYTLGLRPFGLATLRIYAVFTITFAYMTLPQYLVGIETDPNAPVGMLSFLLVMVAFFLLPLVGFHSKLVKAKRERLRWILERYAEIVRRFEERSPNDIDPNDTAELLAAKEVLRDVQQIRTWPFDTGILIRLVAFLLTVAGLLVARVIYTFIVPF